MTCAKTSTDAIAVGDVVSNYTVKALFGAPGRRPKHALVSCACGSSDRRVSVKCLRYGQTRSCGCLQRKAVTKHGMWGTPVFGCWRGMMSRCYNPKDKRYARYGGRGIAVCKRWHDLEQFVADMGDSFLPGLTIDRIDNHKGYEPSNCRWASRAVQNRNYSRNVILEHSGQAMCLTDWSTQTGINFKTLHTRYKAGWPTERLLTTPARALTKLTTVN